MKLKTEKSGKLLPYLLIIVLLLMTMSMLLQLDWVVHNTLYSYDLRFSFEWAVPYWTFLRICLALLGSAVVAVGFIGYRSYRKTTKEENGRLEMQKVVFICSSCGNTWTDLQGRIRINPTLPKPTFLRNCPSCNKQLIYE